MDVDVDVDGARASLWRRLLSVAVLLVGVIGAPLFLSGLWEGIVAKGLALAIAFLSYTIVTGEGGMISLCQITFAGVAAALTADLATNHGDGTCCSRSRWPRSSSCRSDSSPRSRACESATSTSRSRPSRSRCSSRTPTSSCRRSTTSTRASTCRGRRASATTCPSTTCSSAASSSLPCSFATSGGRRPGSSSTRCARANPPRPRIGISVVRSKLVAFGLSAFVAGLGGALFATYSGRATAAAVLRAHRRRVAGGRRHVGRALDRGRAARRPDPSRCSRSSRASTSVGRVARAPDRALRARRDRLAREPRGVDAPDRARPARTAAATGANAARRGDPLRNCRRRVGAAPASGVG